MEKEEIWQAVLSKIEASISRPNFLTWFQQTGIINIEIGTVTIYVPNGFVKEWLQNKYHKMILAAIRDILPEIKDIEYTVIKTETTKTQSPKKTEDSIHKRKRITSMDKQLLDDVVSLKELAVDPNTNLNPRYSLDNFIVGSFNELAHAAAQSVINNLGVSKDYNPLFIYGGVGLGKTHLIQAIGNEVLKKNNSIKVKYVPAEKFMIEIVESLKSQEMNKLKEKYRTVDLLIIDDIQFISRTEKMQEELFHTFNALHDKNKQIVISSDRPPKAIATLEERLRSRFEGGMIADIGIPDIETRFIILKSKIETKNIVIPEEILRFIAESIKTNIRELEGALNRVIMASKLSNKTLSLEDVKKIIGNHLNAPKKFVSAKKIIKAVAEFYDLKEKDLVYRSRKKEVVKPRQVAMFLLREELKSSYPSIGEKFGGRDHTTAMHSCEKIAKELQINSELENELQMIKERIYQI